MFNGGDDDDDGDRPRVAVRDDRVSLCPRDRPSCRSRRNDCNEIRDRMRLYGLCDRSNVL